MLSESGDIKILNSKNACLARPRIPHETWGGALVLSEESSGSYTPSFLFATTDYENVGCAVGGRVAICPAAALLDFPV